MVKSVLVPAIEYEEKRDLLPEDENLAASLYEITLFDRDEVIALGQPVYTFIERNLIFYPIYLVKDEKVTSQIGLYEVFADNLVNVLDEDGDINLDLMSLPLLYGFVMAASEADTSEAGTADADTASAADASTSAADTAGTDALEALPEQTAADATAERAAYTADEDNHWIQAYMNNNNYRMVDNEGGGECLFAVIRDALAKVGIAKSVDEMRQLLAENATEEIFQGYKTMYNEAAIANDNLLKEINTLTTRHKALKTKIDTLKDRNAREVVIVQADEIKKRHDLAKREQVYPRSIIQGELKTMKTVRNLTQFKALVQTCAFWGDTWAISTLERVLNVKLILFSEENYKAGDIENVLTRGQLNDTVLEKKGRFEPDYYILTLYQGYHYQMISYKDRGALKFAELPYDVKLKVVDKCLERLVGPYYIIPEFRKFMEGQAKQVAGPAALAPEEELQSDLFEHASTLQFYNKSVSKPPGKGVGEVGNAADFKDLVHITDWRRKLDNSWLAPFTLDKHTWNSVEHYYQGAKFKRQHPDYYLQLSAVSGSDLSKDPVLAKEAGTKKSVRPKNVTVDEDFSARAEKEMEAAQYAKFSQNAELKQLLLATNKAKLQQFVRAAPPVVATTLMRVRQRLLLHL